MYPDPLVVVLIKHGGQRCHYVDFATAAGRNAPTHQCPHKINVRLRNGIVAHGGISHGVDVADIERMRQHSRLGLIGAPDTELKYTVAPGSAGTIVQDADLVVDSGAVKTTCILQLVTI